MNILSSNYGFFNIPAILKQMHTFAVNSSIKPFSKLIQNTGKKLLLIQQLPRTVLDTGRASPRKTPPPNLPQFISRRV